MPTPWIFVALLSLGVAMVAVFSQLLRIEYVQYRSAWERDGKPGGFLWSPPNASRGSRASVMLSWLLNTPPWARDNDYVRRLLWALRILVVTWNLIILGVMLPAAALVFGTALASVRML